MKRQNLELSIVMPVYNGEWWLAQTVNKTIAAVKKADIKIYELIIVNDGSKDQTIQVAQRLVKDDSHIRLVEQHNSGRFITRKKGVQLSKYNRILFVDLRTWIYEDSLKFLADQISINPDRKVWNAHINVQKRGNAIARFGDAMTLIGWRRYFKNPRLINYGISDFDYYPKGTGLFTAPKATIVDAIKWFEDNTNDIKNSSDDTLMIRHIASKNRIWMSPEYSGKYFARTSLKEFAGHSYKRGQFFVDGFLRKGTRFYSPLVCFLAICILVPVTLLIKPVLFITMLQIMSGLWLLEFIAAKILGLSLQDALSLFILTPIFTIMYGLGIWRAVIRRVKYVTQTKRLL